MAWIKVSAQVRKASSEIMSPAPPKASSTESTEFTKLVAGSSITFIYGAFAAVPLFLLWVYISWTIVLLAAIFVHSLSAYQSDEQLRKPLLLKALEVLELLWRRQSSGRALSEFELLRDRRVAVNSDSWQVLRDKLLANRIIAQNHKGHYLLSRDLHELPLWKLREILDEEHDLPVLCDGDQDSPWRRRASELLEDRRLSARDSFSLSLAELFKS